MTYVSKIIAAPVTVGPSMEVAQSATVPTSDNTVAIISVVVSAAVFIALIIAATVIIVIALILRSRKAECKPNRLVFSDKVQLHSFIVMSRVYNRERGRVSYYIQYSVHYCC